MSGQRRSVIFTPENSPRDFSVLDSAQPDGKRYVFGAVSRALCWRWIIQQERESFAAALKQADEAIAGAEDIPSIPTEAT